MLPWARCTSVSHIPALCLVMADTAPVQIGHTKQAGHVLWWAIVGKTDIHKCGLNLSSSLWLGSKPLSTCSWRGESGVPTDLLLLHIALQPYKGVSLPCVRPQDLCVQYMARTTHTQGISPTVSSPLYSESSPMGTRQDLNHPFPFIHFSLC